MSSAFTARRRADQFDTALRGGATTEQVAAFGELLEVVSTMRELPPAEPRPGFVRLLRSRLMTAAETELRPAPSPTAPTASPRRRGPRERRLVIAVGGFAMVGATASMAMAAQTALPGETLYPIKRAIENAHTGISLGDDAKGTTLLSNASGRLQEINELTVSNDPAPGNTIVETLDVFSAQSVEASALLLDDYAQTGNESSIEELRNFTAVSIETLDQLAAVVPEDARDALMRAARTVLRIDSAAQDVCPGCTSEGITEIPPSLIDAAQSLPSGTPDAVPAKAGGTSIDLALPPAEPLPLLSPQTSSPPPTAAPTPSEDSQPNAQPSQTSAPDTPTPPSSAVLPAPTTPEPTDESQPSPASSDNTGPAHTVKQVLGGAHHGGGSSAPTGNPLDPGQVVGQIVGGTGLGDGAPGDDAGKSSRRAEPDSVPTNDDKPPLP